MEQLVSNEFYHKELTNALLSLFSTQSYGYSRAKDVSAICRRTTATVTASATSSANGVMWVYLNCYCNGSTLTMPIQLCSKLIKRFAKCIKVHTPH